MTAPAQGVAEAAAVAAKFQAALIQLGIQTIALALALWRRVPAREGSGDVAEEWLERAVRMVATRRRLARDLAVAYYRLDRALRTGRTIPNPRSPTPATVRLGSLRAEFERMVDLAAEGASEAQTEDAPTPTTPQGRNDAQIPVERFDGLTDDGDDEEDEIEEDAEQEARVVLLALGPRGLRRRLEEIDTTKESTKVDAERDEAHAKSGSRIASAMERLVLNGGRSAVWSLADRDKRVLGWARASTTGTPCGWCAMLISRGAVYRSEKSATLDGEGDQYHDNCHCVAIPMYSRSEYQNSPRFALNREYEELWPRVTRGLSGKAALSAWRKYIRQQQKSNRQAQAA